MLMCGRYALDSEYKEVKHRFDTITDALDVERRYNVAPGQFMPIILRKSPNTAVLARWGLIPSWSKEPKVKFSTINARAENLMTSPVYRNPFQTQRCLVPTAGFIEWKRISDKEKIPYYIHLKNKKLFAFAGLYDIWKDAEGYPLMTFTIITTQPNSLMDAIHNRMPVVLSKIEEDMWLDPEIHDSATLLKMLDPYPADDMQAHRVSRMVNSPANDSPDILKPNSY